MKSTRREFLGMLGFSLGSATIFSSVGLLPSTKKVIRPPGANNEKIFLEKCLRCQQCVNACPEKALRVSHLLEGFKTCNTPVLHSRCTLCLSCVKTCPSGALDKNITKETAKMGVAEVIPSECIGCGKCVRACEFNALTVLKEENLVKVNPVKCKGCFACVHACPVEPKGIKVTPLP